MFSRFSGEISATIATIFDVPMSRPTMRFLLSFTMLAVPYPAFLTGFSLNPGIRMAKPLR